MSRIVNRNIEMIDIKNDHPYRFLDGGMVYVVCDLIDTWKESGAWWNHEPDRTMYRVITEDGAMFDLEHTDVWHIYRVWD